MKFVSTRKPQPIAICREALRTARAGGRPGHARIIPADPGRPDPEHRCGNSLTRCEPNSSDALAEACRDLREASTSRCARRSRTGNPG